MFTERGDSYLLAELYIQTYPQQYIVVVIFLILVVNSLLFIHSFILNIAPLQENYSEARSCFLLTGQNFIILR